MAQTNAQAAQDARHPQAGDTESWSFYCAGFEKELQRQATDGNDRREFSEAMRRRQNLFAQSNYFFASKAWAGGNDDFAWRARGDVAAGKDVWAGAPLSKDGNAIRVRLRAARHYDRMLRRHRRCGERLWRLGVVDFGAGEEVMEGHASEVCHEMSVHASF